MTARVGIIGYPLGHSVSPIFQQAAFDHLGIDARYEAWPTSEIALKDRVESLRAPGVLGANVTVPYKQTVMPMLDTVEPVAETIGAVNTIINRDGRLVGLNTDATGFMRSPGARGRLRPIGKAHRYHWRRRRGARSGVWTGVKAPAGNPHREQDGGQGN